MSILEGAKVVELGPYFWTTLSGKKTFDSLSWIRIHFLTPGGDTMWYRLDFSETIGKPEREAIYAAIGETFGIPGIGLGVFNVSSLKDRYVKVDRLSDLACFTPEPAVQEVAVPQFDDKAASAFVPPHEQHLRIIQLEEQLKKANVKSGRLENELARVRPTEWLVRGPDDRWHIATLVLDMVDEDTYEPAWVDRNGAILFHHDICRNVRRLPE